jgi:pentatricopeptide repeat protein
MKQRRGIRAGMPIDRAALSQISRYDYSQQSFQPDAPTHEAAAPAAESHPAGDPENNSFEGAIEQNSSPPDEPVTTGDELQRVTEAAQAAAAHKEWAEASLYAERMRALGPEQPTGYHLGSWALGISGRFDEAEAVLREAERRFPDDAWPFEQAAWLAQALGLRDATIEHAERARKRFPERIAGYLVGANALHGTARFDEAETLLREAAARFPDEAGPLEEMAWAAQAQAKWSIAIEYADQLRARFPERQPGYMIGVYSARAAARFDAAEGLLRDAEARFPGEAWPLQERIELAQHRGDWAGTIMWSEKLRKQFPALPAGYHAAIRGLCRTHRFDEAEELVRDSMDRFPEAPWPYEEGAQLAQTRADWSAAYSRWTALRTRFPANIIAYTGPAQTAQWQGDLALAEKLWAEAEAAFPDQPEPALGHALVPSLGFYSTASELLESSLRLQEVSNRFPYFREAYLARTKLLRKLGKLEEAAAVISAAATYLPDDLEIALERGRLCSGPAESIQRFEEIVERFPDAVEGYIALASALAAIRRFADADSLCEAAMQRFPNARQPLLQYATNAMLREDWDDAVDRWANAEARYPGDNEIARGLFEARSAQIGSSDSHAATAIPDARTVRPINESSVSLQEMLADFESLGGTGQGCEFGLVQREVGAEPLGLLRWSHMIYTSLLDALDSGFAGIGDDAQTEVLIEGPEPEYVIADRRYGFSVHTFISPDSIPREKMISNGCSRLRFLRRKLLEELEIGNKIFVYKIAERNLSLEEAQLLHSKLRGYGPNTLLYVRYEDDDHPTGTVERIDDGLMIGYINQFSLTPEGEARRPAMESWIRICTEAHRVWRERAQRQQQAVTG